MNPYYEINNGEIELTDTGQYILDYLGLSLDALRTMTKEELIARCKQMGDVLNDGVVRTSVHYNKHSINNWGNMPGSIVMYNDSGSFSRYFSLDKWAEEHLPESVLKTFPFLLVPKPSPSEKNAGLDELPDKQMYKCDNSGQSLEIFGTTDGGRKPRKNIHPTCKPVTLMAYLITMGSRPGDVVLDPYLGSGTTAVACVNLKRHFVGCDIDPEACEIATLRTQHAQNETTAEAEQLEFKVEGGV